MDKLTIRKEIAALINSIKEHSDNIGANEHIPQLELELILHKIEKLYKNAIVFNHLNSLPKATESIKPAEEIKAPKEIAPVETIAAPIDLFGSELPPTAEKQKTEKKSDKKENLSADKVGKTTVNKIQKLTITDLKSAIGINDKFQYINELFEGNAKEYDIAIQQLNTAETIESAMEYYISLQQLYNWDTDNETAKRLLELVDRRYS